MDGGKIYNNSSNNLGGAFYIKTGTSTFNGGEISGWKYQGANWR